jgi:hypothetical protein
MVFGDCEVLIKYVSDIIFPVEKMREVTIVKRKLGPTASKLVLCAIPYRRPPGLPKLPSSTRSSCRSLAQSTSLGIVDGRLQVLGSVR